MKKLLGLCFLALMCSCSSHNEVIVPISDYRNQLMFGKVKSYTYYEYESLKNEEGMYVPDTSSKMNISAIGIKFSPYMRDISIGIGYKGFINSKGNLTKEYIYATGESPTFLCSYKYENNNLSELLTYKLPDSIDAKKYWLNKYSNGVLKSRNHYTKMDGGDDKKDTMILVLSSKLFYDKLGLLSNEDESENKYIAAIYYARNYLNNINEYENKKFSYKNDVDEQGYKRIRQYLVNNNVEGSELYKTKTFHSNGNLKSERYYENNWEFIREYNEQGYSIFEKNRYPTYFLYDNFDIYGNWQDVKIVRIINGDTIPYSFGKRKISYY
ncbi:hypothetical protein PY092_18990 [Muricauda sp. 334s03]|uniref:Lipoprotein n=1 Tax=Flagellimonas yonaguniensis TaxID=3031325 RepID=A0ABT5Y483_9FLAO|nr:hypothetical protein [[Muricauda] yonaguniensis]MDF0718256.1 hypothetical protein [[Muricauda] yonaguniensis]